MVNAYGFGPGKSITDLNPEQKDSLLSLIGWKKIQLSQDNIIKKESPHIYVDFNAIAKGYTVDIVGDFLLKSGSFDFMVEIGGEIVARGNSPKTGQAWKIAIDNPRQVGKRDFLHTLTLQDQALASSGNYRKYRIDTITGERFVHSINPLNGSALKTNILSTSVKAPDCLTADAWATALMVMPFEKGKALIENDPQLEAIWSIASEEDLQLIKSRNW